MKLPKQIYLIALATSFLTACNNGKQPANASDSTSSNSSVASKEITSTDNTVKPNTAFKDFTPNELGKVMVLEYHLIGEPEDRWRRTPENFRKDLQMLYDNNFYPVSVLDLAYGKLDIPAGKTPFALTFDDSSAGQFRFIEKNGKLEVDPSCAVGIMEDFKKKHSDFPLTASFYVLPAIKPNLRLFAQPEYKKEKLEWLINNGYEIGNHGWYHVPLNKLDDAGVQKHLGMFVKEIKEFIPNYEVKSLALPLGMRAKNLALEAKGKFEDASYNHEVVLLVGSATSVSPYHKNFNRLGIERVQAGDTDYGPAHFMKLQDKNKTRYYSDGDPKTITAPDNYKDQINTQFSKSYKINWIKADSSSTK